MEVDIKYCSYLDMPKRLSDEWSIINCISSNDKKKENTEKYNTNCNASHEAAPFSVDQGNKNNNHLLGYQNHSQLSDSNNGIYDKIYINKIYNTEYRIQDLL